MALRIGYWAALPRTHGTQNWILDLLAQDPWHSALDTGPPYPGPVVLRIGYWTALPKIHYIQNWILDVPPQDPWRSELDIHLCT